MARWFGYINAARRRKARGFSGVKLTRDNVSRPIRSRYDAADGGMLSVVGLKEIEDMRD